MTRAEESTECKVGAGTQRPPAPKLYRTILADPPWDIPRAGNHSAEQHYPLLSVERIAALRVDRLVAADAHLWLWVTNASLHTGKTVMEAWDFTYRSCLTWIKPRFGLEIGRASCRERV